MKKALLLLMIVAIILSISACGNEPSEDSNGADQNGAQNQQQSEANDFAYEITYSKANTYTDSIGSVWVQTIVEITNTGSKDLYLSAGSYDLEDNTGKLIASQSLVSTYPEVISPNEKAYMYEETTLDSLPEGELTIVARPSVESSKLENIRYNVTDVVLSDDEYGGIKALGRVENTTPEDDLMAYVVITLKDAYDKPIGLLFTISEIKAGEKVGFETTGFSLPPEVKLSSVSSFDAFAYPSRFQF